MVLNIKIVVDVPHSLSPHLNKELATLRSLFRPHVQLEVPVAGLGSEPRPGLVVQPDEHPVRGETGGQQQGADHLHLVGRGESVESQLQRLLRVLRGRA